MHERLKTAPAPHPDTLALKDDPVSNLILQGVGLLPGSMGILPIPNLDDIAKSLQTPPDELNIEGPVARSTEEARRMINEALIHLPLFL